MSLELEEEKGQGFTIMSWNINGMRTLNMKNILDQLKCTILSVQETKLSRNQLEQSQALIPNYTSYFSFSKNRAGYSGVATYCHNDISPAKSEEGLSGATLESSYKLSDKAIGGYCLVGEEDLSDAKYGDVDGRAVITQHIVKTPNGEEKRLNVINVYCPRLRDDPMDEINNTDFKLTFHSNLAERAKNLVEAGQFVLIVGDLNISHKIIDQADIDDPVRFRQTEFREWLDELMDPNNSNGLQDTFRALHPNREGAFTCWCTKLNARQNNYGTRIDFILADKDMMKYLDKADIHPDVLGSDHCPISATFHSLVLVQSEKIPLSATKFYPEFAGKQQTLKDLFKKCEKPSAVVDKLQIQRDRPQINSTKRPLESVSKGPKQTNLSSFFVKRPKTEYTNSDNQISESDTSAARDGNQFFKEVNSTASQAWKQLLKTPDTPLCKGHNEMAVLRTVKKKGPHQGRQFWACARGTGKDNDPNANCNYFCWSNSKT